MKTLIHTASQTIVEIDDQTAQDLFDQLSADGFKIGLTSLRKLLNGQATTCCGFEVVETEDDEENTGVVADQGVVTTPIVEVATVVDTTAPVVTETAAVEVKAMRESSKMYKAAVKLIEGATVAELMVEFGYTEGGAGATLFCKQSGVLSKGYTFEKEKVEGRGTVLFICIDGKRLTSADQILVQAKKS